MKLKCPNLLKPLGTIFEKKCQSFDPLELFSYVHITMIQGVYARFLKNMANSYQLILLLSLVGSHLGIHFLREETQRVGKSENPWGVERVVRWWV